MTESADLSIARGIAELIATEISPTLVPTTTLAAPVAAGDTVIALTDTAGFVAGGRFDVWDGTQERSWSIAAVDYDANTLTLKTAGLTGLGITGLLTDHDALALVTTNLMSFEAVKIGHMFVADQPVVLVYALDDASKIIAARRSGAVLRLNIEIRRSIVRRDDNPIDENDWVNLQQGRIRRALQTIQDTVQGNRHLVTSQGPLSLGLGDGSPGPEFKKAWGRLVIHEDNEQYCGVLSATVRGAPHTF